MLGTMIISRQVGQVCETPTPNLNLLLNLALSRGIILSFV